MTPSARRAAYYRQAHARVNQQRDALRFGSLIVLGSLVLYPVWVLLTRPAHWANGALRPRR